MAMQTGTVRKFGQRGFGFVESDSGDDLFLHIRDSVDSATPKPGQRVKFVLGKSDDGRLRALKVRVIDETC